MLLAPPGVAQAARTQCSVPCGKLKLKLASSHKLEHHAGAESTSGVHGSCFTDSRATCLLICLVTASVRAPTISSPPAACGAPSIHALHTRPPAPSALALSWRQVWTRRHKACAPHPSGPRHGARDASVCSCCCASSRPGGPGIAVTAANAPGRRSCEGRWRVRALRRARLAQGTARAAAPPRHRIAIAPPARCFRSRTPRPAGDAGARDVCFAARKLDIRLG